MNTTFTHNTSIVIPDRHRITRAKIRPDLGPRILFFSGGTALRETSQALISYTHNSVHLITPFDSGGSSAVLRRYFNMPAVGDLRFRLMALADRSMNGYPAIYNLFAYRFSKTAEQAQLRAELQTLITGTHSHIAHISPQLQEIICMHLQHFAQAAGQDFDLRGASVGNLILTAGYLENNRRIEPIVGIYSKLVRVRGEVHLLLNSNLHLCARLENGVQLIGQHLITGKEEPAIASPIKELRLIDPCRNDAVVHPHIAQHIVERIQSADLICYPMGSFYSSLIANLLPAGTGHAIRNASCAKVYIPNTFFDSESLGLTLPDQIRILQHHLRNDAPDTIRDRDVLNFVLIDPDRHYPGITDFAADLSNSGVQVVRARLIRDASGAIDPELLCQALISLT